LFPEGRRPGAGSWPLETCGGHLIIRREHDLALLDTGAPVSLPAPASLTRHVGVRVAEIIGMDQLDGEIIEFDGIGRRVRFGRSEAEGPGVPLRRCMGLPVLDVTWGHGCQPALLDTGAKLSYAPADAVERGRDKDTRSDFLPGYGEFEVRSAVVELGIGDRQVRLRCGVLPPELASTLRALGLPQWIIGAELFLRRRLVLDLQSDRLIDPVRRPPMKDSLLPGKEARWRR
jgi:hypothetical protein